MSAEDELENTQVPPLIENLSVTCTKPWRAVSLSNAYLHRHLNHHGAPQVTDLEHSIT